MRMFRRSSPDPSTGFSDRGPAKYFHGRRKILSSFHELLLHANQNKRGTTFLIQGAPGAGKTALLAECEKRALEKKWEVVELPVRAIWSVDELRRSLGLGKIPVVKRGSAQVGGDLIGKLEVTAELASETMLNILRSRKDPLLLMLDEAQRIGTTISLVNADQFAIATDMLNAIHNGTLDRPVILMAAGLGTTAAAFESLGVSRFNKKCLVELGALDKEAECAVIHDWLKKEGSANGDPTAWIDAISRETCGWPHHILSYVEPAVNQLGTYNGVMTTEGLNTVLDAGREFRSEYYERRAHDFDEEQRHCFAKSLADIPPGDSTTRSAIMDSLMQDFSPDEAEKLFHRALHRGILHKRRGRYTVPIPSLHEWLVSKYAKIEFLHGWEVNPDGTSKRIKILR